MITQELLDEVQSIIVFDLTILLENEVDEAVLDSMKVILKDRFLLISDEIESKD